MIYNEDFNLIKATEKKSNNNHSISYNTKNNATGVGAATSVTDRTRATIRESTNKHASSKSTVNQVLNYSQNSMSFPLNKTFNNSRQQNHQGVDTTTAANGLTRVSSSGYNFSFSLNNMDSTNNTGRVPAAA